MPQFASMVSSDQQVSVDASPLLPTFLPERRRLIRPPSVHLRTAARLLRRASSRRMMLREPSVRVRENAAEQLEERQSDWAYSKPIIVMDVIWNLALVATAISVLVLSWDETPHVPLRVWVGGYAVQCLVHVGCVVMEYRRRRDGGFVGDEDGSVSEREDFDDDDVPMLGENNGSVAKQLESVNNMLSFIWWIVGFYWVTDGGETLTSTSPQLYWLCITFLAFDVVFVVICVVVACLISIAVCCCLPCIIAILYVVKDQEGATKEDIEQLPKFKFQMNNQKANSAVRESCQGVMIECDTESPTERAISIEDAECCICLSPYDDGTELRELPCHHHFHCDCIEKWLYINATCPLCKFNILKNQSSRDEV